MASTVFNNIKIAGLSGAIPTVIKNNHENNSVPDKEALERIVKITGVEEFRQVHSRQTAGDLAFVAADRLLTELNIARNDIGLIINVTTTPDYIYPSTAFVLHKRLRLPMDCIGFDVNLQCSGFVYGYQLCCSYLQCISSKYAILINAEGNREVDYSDRKNPDHSITVLTGDAATVLLIEKVKEAKATRVDNFANGSEYNVLVKQGGTRNSHVSREVTMWSDGHDRSILDAYMNGMAVFNFSTRTVPDAIKAFMKEEETSKDDYEMLYLHQANKMIIDRIVKLLKWDKTKVPTTLPKYGNTSGASIPITIIDQLGENDSDREQHILVCGFGSGLSWGVASLDIKPSVVLPIIETDEFYEEGEINPF